MTPLRSAATRRLGVVAKSLLPTLAGTLVLLGTLELGARIAGLGNRLPVAAYVNDWRTRWQGEFYTFDSEREDINSDGVRDVEHEVANRDDRFRLVMLGDSVTFGFRVPREHSVPAVLRDLLDERAEHVEVFSVALNGWSARQQRTAYQRIARRYEPDRVILGLCLNDVAEMHNNLTRPQPLVSWLFEHSNLLRYVLRVDEREVHSVEELFERPDSAAVRSGWRLLFDEIAGLQRDVEADGAELSLIVYPFRLQVEAGAPAPVAQREIEKFAAARGLAFLDLLPALAPLGPRGFVDHDHLSLAGATRVAGAMIEAGFATPGRWRAEADSESLEP